MLDHRKLRKHSTTNATEKIIRKNDKRARENSSLRVHDWAEKPAQPRDRP
jgi:hypothetical protein